jgi:protein-arginine deiminase
MENMLSRIIEHRTDPRVAAQGILILGKKATLPLRRYAPAEATLVQVEMDRDLTVQSEGTGRAIAAGQQVDLASIPDLILQSSRPSSAVGDQRIRLTFMKKPLGTVLDVEIALTSFVIGLEVDADRDGMKESHLPNGGTEDLTSTEWTWGPSGRGAILLVNNDQDSQSAVPWRRDRRDRRINGPLDLEDLSKMAIRVDGPPHMPDCFLKLAVGDGAADRIRIFELNRASGRQLIGPGEPAAVIPYEVGVKELAVEGLSYPDRGFTGFVTVYLDFVWGNKAVYTDSVVYRVAPWIMCSNTQRPDQVYVCRLEDGDNARFIETLRGIARQADVEVVEVPPSLSRGDRWIQDEIELGYSMTMSRRHGGPGTKTVPVVLDSSRDRGLDAYAKDLLGPDFGYARVTRTNPEIAANSLDSFGNLEASPPVTVRGRFYPLGRILFGGARPNDQGGRRMTRLLGDFLYAQQVQDPVELFSDWLLVGHVDEFVTFVPAPKSSKGFKCLLASPAVCLNILHDLARQGHDAAVLFEGKRYGHESAERTVRQILDDTELVSENERYQSYIDWNRNVLRQELGLKTEDIVDIPALFGQHEGRAVAYFPNMVNLIVLKEHLGIPKPYGPRLRGRKECEFERFVRDQLEDLGLACHFIDDWYAYFVLTGGIHCGTNTKRLPYDTPWWFLDPSSSGRYCSYGWAGGRWWLFDDTSGSGYECPGPPGWHGVEGEKVWVPCVKREVSKTA